MYTMNQLTIIGFTGNDAEAHYTPNGTLAFLARDLKLIRPDDYEKLAQQTTEIKRMLTVFVQKLTAEG